MNLIVICADTFRADYMGCYGNDWIHTPNLDRFAERSVTFDSAWAEALPTIEARRVYFTGHGLLPFPEDEKAPRGVFPTPPGWMPLREDRLSVSEILQDQGYFTGLICDTWHFFKPGMNMHRGFDTWEWVRGQERDFYGSAPEGSFDTRDYVPEHLWDENVHERLKVYLRNTQDFHSEEDYFCARTFRKAVQWLENNRDKKPFFLWVDTFDPHEPWDCPRDYAELYHDDYPCERFIYLYGIDRSKTREEDWPAIRGLYAGLVTLVDRWAGHLLDAVERMGLFEDTLVVFTTDHGTEIGEHGTVQKAPHLMYGPCVRLPLLVHHPDTELEGVRTDGLVSAADFLPTFLHRIGAESPEAQFTGADAWPAVEGRAVRDHVVTGWSWWGSVRTEQWNYVFRTRGEQTEPQLYRWPEDPVETENVAAEHPEVVKRLQQTANRTWPGLF
ncbi:MAG: sulfatase [Planctomycetota bacterium]